MKTYKGLDLVKAVANYEIEKGTKLKCIHYPTYGQGIEVDEYQERLIWSDTKKPIRYSHFLDSKFEFEIIGEEKEIEELSIIKNADNTTSLQGKDFNYTMKTVDVILANKINELVREVRKLKDKL